MDIGQFTIIFLTIVNLVREKTRSGEGTGLRTLFDKNADYAPVSLREQQGKERMLSTKLVPKFIQRCWIVVKRTLSFTFKTTKIQCQGRESLKASAGEDFSKTDCIGSNSSLYLVDLFQKRMGGTGYINRLAHCKSCDHVIIIGENCSTCKREKGFQSNQTYLSALCSCYWNNTRNQACNLTIKAGYCSQLTLDILTKDTWIDHVDLNQIYCYSPKEDIVSYATNITQGQVFCNTCYKNDSVGYDKLQTIQLTDSHITSLLPRPTKCQECNTEILQQGDPTECIICSVNSFFNYEELMQYKETIVRKVNY